MAPVADKLPPLGTAETHFEGRPDQFRNRATTDATMADLCRLVQTHSEAQMWLFGSALTSRIPADLDVLLIYRCAGPLWLPTGF